ncbi:MAG: hypothetical protein IT440_06215 [Phycisphaeraceae bacterium]|nr:hypothetical protein [Phycisphaeraceae bacterium]
MHDGISRTSSVCGFSFGRNLTRLNYPVEAAVRSVLPLCDRFVFAVGQSDDDTRDRVAAIDPKIEILDTQWPDVRVDGTVLSIEANKAMTAAEASGCTWGFYIQADEVVHEDDLPAIAAAMDHWASNPNIKALLFRFLHFVLDYQTVDPWMYHKASRVVRLDRSCTIVGDACGPGIKDYAGPIHGGNGYLDKHHMGVHVQWAADPARRIQIGKPARIFHYGWVKTDEELADKFTNVEQLWWGTLDKAEKERRKNNKFGKFIDRYPLLKKFHGTHPAVMADRVAARPPLARVANRWLNPRFYREIVKHGFHG